MSDVYKNLAVVLTANTTSLEAGMRKAATTVSGLNKEIAGLNASSAGAGTSSDALGLKIQKASVSLGQAQLNAQGAATRLNALKTAAANAGGEIDAGLATKIQKADLALQSSNLRVQQAALNLKGLQNQTAVTTTASNGLSTALKTGLAVGAVAVAGALYESAKAAATFQAQMTKLNTQAGAGLDPQQFKAVESQVLGLSGALGFSPTSLAQSLFHVYSAGFSGAQGLDIMTNAAKLAKVGGADFETTTQAVIGSMQAFKDQGLTASQAVATLNATVGAGDIKMQQLATAIGVGVLPVFNSVGLGLKDFGAAIALFGDNVTPPEQAATRLRTTLQQMANPTGAASKGFQELNLGTTQLADDLRRPNGLLVATQDLKKHYDDLSAKDGPVAAFQALSTAFGRSRGSSYVMELVTELPLLQQKYDQIIPSTQRFAVAWADTQATVNQKTQQIEAGLQSLAIRIGTVLLPQVGNLEQGFIDLGKNTDLKSYLHSLEPDLSAIGDDFEHIMKFLGDVVKDIAPLGAAFAAIAGSSIAETLRIVGDALSDIAVAADHVRPLVDAIALSLGVKYALSVATATASMLSYAAADAAAGAAASLATTRISGLNSAIFLARGSLLSASEGAVGMAGGFASMTVSAGLLLPLLGTLALAHQDMATDVANAKNEVNNFAKAIQAEGPGVTTNTQALVAGSLAHASYQQALRSLSLTSVDVTSAITGNTITQDSFRAKLEATYPSLVNNAKAQNALTEAFAGNKNALHDLTTSGAQLSPQMLNLIGEITDLSKHYGDGTKASDAMTEALGKQYPAGAAVANSLQQLGLSAQGSSTDIQQLQADVDSLQKSFSGWSNITSAADAALKDAQDRISAASTSSSSSVKQQKQDLTAQHQQTVANLREQETAITNNNKVGRDAVQQQIAAENQKYTSQKNALAQQKSLDSQSAASTKDATKTAIASIDDMIAEYDKQNTDLQSFQQNLVIIASKYGLSIAQEAQKLGPQYAGVIGQLANDTSGKGQKLADEIGQSLDLQGLAPEIETQMQEVANSANKSGQLVGVALVKGLKGNVEAIKQVASDYQVDLYSVADPILQALGIQRPAINPAAGVNNGTAFPYGTLAQSHAEGGIENHTAQIGRGTPVRIWAEPETGGEAYIPMADSKSQRSQGIWEQVGRIKGWTLGPFNAFADGGVTLPPPPNYLPTPTAFPYGVVSYEQFQIIQKAVANSQSSSYGGPAAGAPQGQVVDWIHQAEAIAKWPDTYTNGIYQLVQHESGGNPRAINLSDSNAKAGHPSKGATQTIDSTFNAYKYPGHPDIFNPVDNILAGISYALKNYGPSMVIAGGRHNAAGNYIGYGNGGINFGVYDSGGSLMPGTTIAYNNTGRPETVMTSNDIDRIISAINQSGKGGNQIYVQAPSPVDAGREVRRALA